MRNPFGWAIAVALSVACGTAPVAAQGSAPRFHVRGHVVDPTGSPLPGAQVTLTGSAPVVTARNGRFDLGEVSPGRYTLEVRRIGFEPASRDIVLLDRDVDMVIELKPSAVMLDTVKTSALQQRLPRLFHRMDIHLGRVAFGDSLRARYPDASVTDFLKFDKGMAAMLAVPRSKAHACGVWAYIDGHRVRRLDPSSSTNPDSLGIQEEIQPRDVAAIEAFQSPDFVNELFIPNVGEIGGPSECTRIILIWTKYYHMHPHQG